jgi:hypothetical protein
VQLTGSTPYLEWPDRTTQGLQMVQTAAGLVEVSTPEGPEHGQVRRRSSIEVVGRLAKQFPQVPVNEVAGAVSESRPEFDSAPIREFVPLFVERSAKHPS